ncbi:MAG: hypothetical protein A2083_09830, partial [Gemmatimonadetes bacterium GWC2_71_9]
FLFFLALNGFLLLPLYVKRLGGSEADVGLVQSMFSVAGILCQPLIGLWVDRLGRRLFMLLGVGLLTLSSAAFIVGVSIPVAAALRALHGIAFSLFFVANYVHIVDLVPVARRGWALGIFGLSGLVSTAVAPLIGEAVIRRLGFGWSFAVSSLVAVVALILVLRTREVRPPIMGAGPGVEAFRVGLQELLRIHMALGFFFGLGTGTLFTFLPTFAEHMGVTGLGLFYTGYSASAMAVRVFGGNLIDTRGRRAVIVPSMFVQTAAVAVLALLASLLGPTLDVPVLPFLLLAGVMAGGAHGFLYPALSALVVDVTPEAMDLLVRHRWPGNVRELANIVERLIILSGRATVTADDVRAALPAADAGPGPLPSPAKLELALSDELDRYERTLITRALSAARGNVAEAARALATDRANLYRRMKRLDIEPPP